MKPKKTIAWLKKWLGSVCVLLLLLMILFTADAFCDDESDPKVFTVVGASWVGGENLAKARDNAIAVSLASAVQQATVELISLEAFAANFQTLNQGLLGKTDRYVRGFKVLAEGRSGSHYRVLAQVRVALDAISADLAAAGIVADDAALPSVLLILVEKQADESWPLFWRGEDQAFLTPFSEAAIQNGLAQKKLTVVARADHIDFLQTVVLKSSPDFSPEEVVELGRRLQVGVVVVGHGEAAPAPNSMAGTRQSFQGAVRLQAFGSDAGQLLASSVFEATVISDNEEDGLRQALAAAGEGAGADLAAKIVTAWRKTAQKPSAITMVVNGTRNLGPFVLFRRAVGDLPRVKQMQMTEMKADEATIVVEFTGNAQGLADAILLKTFESFSVNITDIAEGYIKVTLVSR